MKTPHNQGLSIIIHNIYSELRNGPFSETRKILAVFTLDLFLIRGKVTVTAWTTDKIYTRSGKMQRRLSRQYLSLHIQV